MCKADEGVRNLLGKKVTWIRGEELQLDGHEEQRRIEPTDCEPSRHGLKAATPLLLASVATEERGLVVAAPLATAAILQVPR